MKKNKILELFGYQTDLEVSRDWRSIVNTKHCPYLDRRCIKTRKSNPNIIIGTCTVAFGAGSDPIIICPHRLLERGQIFTDCLHLLTLHEPGNELHLVPEITIPGGHIDYMLVSARLAPPKTRKVVDFVAIELQSLDTIGTVWPERQRFLLEVGLPVSKKETGSHRPFGMNWKMTAKTILVQLHHKVQTLQYLSKHLVLVLQDHFLNYMQREFSFTHIEKARLGDPMHFHSYTMRPVTGGFQLELADRHSTDVEGISVALGLQADANVELTKIVERLEARLSERTLLKL